MSNLQLNLNGNLINLNKPIVMGVINVTPDSFYSGNRFTSEKNLLKQVEKSLTEGATILDIGAYSTRPGAEDLLYEEEIKRLSNGIETILSKFPNSILSVDTFRSNVARYVVQNYNIPMINDISGGTLDKLMFETIADLGVAYILMHSRGNTRTMTELTDYENIVSDILHFLENRVAQLHFFGVKDVIIDPGFGFAKTVDQNYELLSKLRYFQSINVPILVGLSRKSMLYKLLGTTPEKSLNATTAANMLALMGGASILRVHDVREAMETIEIYEKYIATNNV